MTVTAGRPKILGIPGSLKTNSSTLRAVQIAIEGAALAGAEATVLAPELLRLPLFDDRSDPTTYGPAVEHFLNAVRGSQGLIIGTPVYYGMFSAALKNALEFIDLTANDTSPLLSGKVLALICVAGDYPSSSALNALYCSCRPLRPWLLPTAVSLTSKDLVVKEGSLVDENIGKRLRDLGKDVAHSVQTIARCSLEPQKR